MSSVPVILQPQTRSEPAIIRAGDTVVWSRRFDDYSSSDVSLSYVYVSPKAQIVVTATASIDVPDAFVVDVPGAQTAVWAPGVYRWEAYVKDGNGNRFTVDQGSATVMPNLEAAVAGLDERSIDERILSAIIDLINGKVLAGDAQKYMIHGRELQRYTFAELRELRNEYALRVRRARVMRGERVSSRTVKVGFRG